MTKTVTLDEARADLAALVEAAAAGEEVVIGTQDGPKARLTALPTSTIAEHAKRSGPRPLGLYAGRVWIADDFDAPWPEDIQRAFDGDDPDDPLNAAPTR